MPPPFGGHAFTKAFSLFKDIPVGAERRGSPGLLARARRVLRSPTCQLLSPAPHLALATDSRLIAVPANVSPEPRQKSLCIATDCVTNLLLIVGSLNKYPI